MVNFGAILINGTFHIQLRWIPFGQLLEKIGLILIPTSGHTASQLRPPQKMGTPNFGRREFEIFIYSILQNAYSLIFI